MLSFVMRHRFGIINLLLWIAFGWLVYIAVKWALPFVLPLLFGILIAILIEPVVKLLQRVKMPRSVASLTTLIVFFGGAAALFLLLAAKLALEFADFSKNVPELTSGLVNLGHDWLNKGIAFYGTLSPSMSEKVREYLGNMSTYLAHLGTSIATAILNGMRQVPSLLTIFLLSLLISYFISKDFPLWQRRLFRLIAPSIREKSDVVFDDLGKATFGYVRAQAILILITFVQSLLGLLILRVPYAFTLALLAAFLDILPLLGTGSLYVPWAIYALVVGDTKLGIGLLILYGLIVAVRQVLEPRILAESIGLDPLLTLVVMYAGYQAIGFFGVILAPFLIITVMSMLKVKAFDFLFDETPPDDADDPRDPPPTS